MKVILLKEQDNLGAEGEIVNVKDGYGRNYLIPQGIAALATKSAAQAWEEEQRQAARKIAQRKGDEPSGNCQINDGKSQYRDENAATHLILPVSRTADAPSCGPG